MELSQMLCRVSSTRILGDLGSLGDLGKLGKLDTQGKRGYLETIRGFVGVSHLFTLSPFHPFTFKGAQPSFHPFTFSPLLFPSNFFFRTSILINDCSAMYEERTKGELSAFS